MPTGNRYDYTDEVLTDQDWEVVLGLNLSPLQIELLKTLRMRGTAIPIAELSKAHYFRGSHVESINQKFSTTFKVPYRLGNDGGTTWGNVHYNQRSLKLYKVKLRNPITVSDLLFAAITSELVESLGRMSTIKFVFPGIVAGDGSRSPEILVKASIPTDLSHGAIHIYPTKEQVDDITAYLLQMRQYIK